MYRYLFVLVAAALGGCSLAPEFQLPATPTPPAFKEQQIASTQEQEYWKPAEPLGNQDRGQWWIIYGDPELNALEEEALRSNLTLKSAASRVQQARATVRASASSFLPDLNLGGNAVRAKPSDASLVAFGAPAGSTIKPYTLYSAQGVLSYEADLFGRVRDNERALRLEADAQEALYRQVLLALQADVAQTYFSLRALDAERALVKNAVKVRTEANRIMQSRFNEGEVGEQDFARTQSELAIAKADAAALDRQRAALEHALAVLLGKMPSEFILAERPLEGIPPEVPAGLPSSLLERRPDINAAISSMAAANARIGVARTAFFPRLMLTASGGFESVELGDLFDWSSRTWALGQLAGSALSMTVFDNGRNQGRLDAAKAAYEEAVADYQQQVLVAFRDVEDSLAAQRLLVQQSVEQDVAAVTARQVARISETRYDEGDVEYFEVVDAERTALATERAAVQTRGQRFLTSIALIRALGGGWEDVPSTPLP